jgi:hypothetical protein
MSTSPSTPWRRTLLAAFTCCLWAAQAGARTEGGVYIAGEGFSFQTAAQRALSQNPNGRRFFLLVLPTEAAALRRDAPAALARQRERVVAGNGVLMVCQRDLDNGRLDAAVLAPQVVPVRGWPAPGQRQLPHGERYFADENRELLPASNQSLQRLRKTCS